jgi:hypothetical protein
MVGTGDTAISEVESPGQFAETATSDSFDNYTSVIDCNLMIFVKKDVVPPFRFHAGGWDLVRSSIKLGPAMQARVAEQGFFMCCLNADRSGWTEVKNLLAPRLSKSN